LPCLDPLEFYLSLLRRLLFQTSIANLSLPSAKI
jgi:hypothetical protein